MAFIFQGNLDNFDIDTYLAIDNDDAKGAALIRRKYD